MPQRDPEATHAAFAAGKRLRNRKASDVAGVRADIAQVHGKPLDDWTLEELASGRPTNFRVVSIPLWMAAVIGPGLSKRISNTARLQMSQYLPDPVRVLHDLATSTAVDEDGRPVLSDKVKLEAAKFIYQHNLGKPR